MTTVIIKTRTGTICGDQVTVAATILEDSPDAEADAIEELDEYAFDPGAAYDNRIELAIGDAGEISGLRLLTETPEAIEIIDTEIESV